MIWVNVIFGLLLLKATTCLIESQGAGGPVDKDPSDPKYLSLAKLSMQYYADGTDVNYLVLLVTKATEGIVSGTVTDIDFYATPCTNSLNCQVINPYNIMSCHSTIYEKPWLNQRRITPTCDPQPRPLLLSKPM